MLKQIKLILIVSYLMLSVCGFTQKKDSVYFYKLGQTFKLHLKGNIDSAKLYAKQILNESKQVNYIKGEGLGNNYLGICNIYSGNYDSAIIYLKKALILYGLNTKTKGICDVYSNMGVCYDYLGNFAEATKNYLKALTIAEFLNDNDGISRASNNIGTLYYQQKNYKIALSYFEKSLKIRELKQDDCGISSCCLNMGSCYQSLHEIQKSNYFLNKSIINAKKCGDSLLLADALVSLGENYSNAYDNKNALNLFTQVLPMYMSFNEPRALSELYSNMALIYGRLNNYTKSHTYYLLAKNLAQSTNYLTGLKNAYEGLIVISAYYKNADSSAYYLNEYKAITDSIYSENNSKQIAMMQTQYQSEKKDNELIVKDLEIQKQLALSKQKSFQLNVFIVAFLIMIVLIIFVYKSYKQKVKANIEINKQKDIITKQKLVVDQKQKEIIDSINYASRIQHSLMPTEKYISKHIKK